MGALAFDSDGFFVSEYDRVFTNHFGRNPDFARIMRTLARHPRGLFRGQLVQEVGLDFIEPNKERLGTGVPEQLFSALSQTGAFHDWLGRAFERLCVQHAVEIARLLGFAGIAYRVGPFFQPPGKDTRGAQVDLLFARDDNVITLCDMKYSRRPVGVEVIDEVERKADVLSECFPKRAIQRVLIVRQEATENVIRGGHFYRILRAEELIYA